MPKLSTISQIGYTTTLLCMLLLLQQGSMEAEQDKFTTKFLKQEGNAVLYEVDWPCFLNVCLRFHVSQ